METSPPPTPQVRTEDTDPMPYSLGNYAGRIAWILVYHTLWKIAWKRIAFLRPLILRAFGAKTSLHVHIAGSVRIEMPWNLDIGDYVAIGPRVYLYNLGKITIGPRTVISQDAYLCAGTHDYTKPTYPLLRPPITIGSQVWITAGAFIGPGITVHDGAVVAARAVVVKDVDEWTVVGGNPAILLKKRELQPN